MTRFASVALIALVGTMSAACLFRGNDTEDPFDPNDPTPAGGCDSDLQCNSSTAPCSEYSCIERSCQRVNKPEGTEVSGGGELTCRKLVCDGQGNTKTVPDASKLPQNRPPSCKRYVCSADGAAVLEPDPTNVSTDDVPACQRITCDANGNVSTAPDPSNTPADQAGDCKLSQCDASGQVTLVPNAADVPEDDAGDCMRDTCTAEGGFAKVVDDSDIDEPSTCKAYGCSNGVRTETPINPTTTCSQYGFVCGADGACGTCPVPDAACSNPGPGSRDAGTAYDFGDIGRTDTGGRTFCGAVPAGAADYTTYYDDGSGFLAVFDPYFEIRPQAAARMCVFFDCPSIQCPAGSASEALEGKPGCCWNAPAGVYTGKKIDFCAGGRVTTRVTTQAACTGYTLHFND